MSDFQGNLARVRERIAAACAAAGRDPSTVTLVAVSKTRPVEAIEEAIAAGLTEFGENRVQEAIPKIERLRAARGGGGAPAAPGSSGSSGPVPPGGPPRPVRFHLIGHLQSNKAGKAVEVFDLIHSIDSESLAGDVNRRAERIGKVQPVLIQVNCSREARKNGCDPADVPALRRAVEACSNLDLRGFMTIGPLSDDPETARPAFRELVRLKSDSEEDLGRVLPELSMGMTGDFEIAIAEGATLIRVGTALFGERHP